MICALVLGRAEGVLEEAAAARKLGKIDVVLATGPVAADYAHDIDYWVWFHAELFQDCALLRAKKGHPPVKSYWSIKYRGRTRVGSFDGVHVNYFNWDEGGSSGLVATMIALEVAKADRILLAGIPMTKEGARYDDHQPWLDAIPHRVAWEKHLPTLQGRVRSFSGWTQQLLGGQPPTTEWMQGIVDAAA